PSVGLLGVRCAVPGVEVWVDGVRRATTPVSVPLLLPAGSRTIRFARSGYTVVTRSAGIVSNEMVELDCAMVPHPTPAGGSRGTLKVSTDDHADVTVDGRPFRSGLLPSGPHAVRVDRAGFVPFTQVVHVEPSRERSLSIALEPTPATIRERDADARRQRTWALGVGIGGLALAGGSVATYVWNANRYDEWSSKWDELQRDLAGGAPSAQQGARTRDLVQDAANIQRVDDLALAMAITAGGALVTAGILWVTSP
ncbi:MAG TPA: PEGA domain-containing protein, partial [Polyangiaceae bacterium]